jgi:N-acetylglucosaminyl-diphospho-decaprenol L-rhamnosyltransferase
VSAQLADGDELVVIDNASADATVPVAREASARVIEAGGNTGFAGGANIGAAATTAPLLMLLNPDAVVLPGTLAALRGAAGAHPDWGAWQALVTMDDGQSVNSAGNVVHYLGFGWAGRCGQPVTDIGSDDEPVGFASGAALVVRREAWDAVGGFDDRYFMYGEDLDLGLRLALRGWGSGLVPAARAEHEYSFAKGDYKWFYLERNRWWTVLGAYPTRLLLVLAPALLAFELALLAAAAKGGWLRPKLRSYGALVRELPAILARRRAIQANRVSTVAELAASLEASLDSPELAGAARVPGVDAAQRAYWRLARKLLR